MYMRKILVVEDEDAIREVVALNLRLAGYEVTEAASAEQALAVFSPSAGFDVAVLDIMLPGMNGFSLCETIRRDSASIGIIMLSAKTLETDKIKGLSIGADDYMTKPFLMQELLLRISGILRRAYRGQLQRETALRLGERTVELSDATVSSAGGTVTLTATERAILQKLLDNRGHIVTYDALCEAVWGSDYYGCENSLNVHIRHLREKVEEQPSQPVWVLTARGLGYKLAKEGTK